MWIWIVEMWKYFMREIFSCIHTYGIFFTIESEKYEEKFPFILFLTKLTSFFISTYFFSLSTNTMKAVMRRKTICYSVSFQKKWLMCFILISYSLAEMILWWMNLCGGKYRTFMERQRKDWGNTRLLILHEIESKLYNRHCPNGNFYP